MEYPAIAYTIFLIICVAISTSVKKFRKRKYLAFVINGVKFLKLKDHWQVEECNENKLWLPSNDNYDLYLPTDSPKLTRKQRKKLTKAIALNKVQT